MAMLVMTRWYFDFFLIEIPKLMTEMTIDLVKHLNTIRGNEHIIGLV